MSLERREARPAWTFLELDTPAGTPPLTPLPKDADGNTRTAHAWAVANAHAALLEAKFGPPPFRASWGFTAVEREFYRGETLAEGDYDYYAWLTLGLLFDPRDEAACAFAAGVRAGHPLFLE